MVRWFGLLLLLLVRPVGAADPFVEAEASPLRPYVQAEVAYRVRLYRSSSFQTGYFFDLEVPGAVVEFSGEDEPVEAIRDGRSLQMIERRYRLFPQRSGRLEIPSPVFSGREAFAKGEPMVLDVRPRPVGAEGPWWLPARALELAEEWRIGPPPHRAGEPLERIVTVIVDGQTGAQIPPIPLFPGMRRLQAEASHERRDGRIVGRRVERQVWIPQEAGMVTVPAIVIPWWDVEEDMPRKASLSGRSFAIAPSSRPAVVSIPAVVADSPVPAGSLAARLAPVPGAVGIGLGLLLALWLADRILSLPRVVRGRRLAAAHRRFARACRDGDAAAARRALLDWGAVRWEPAPRGLRDLGSRLGGESARALDALDSALYGPTGTWAGDEAYRHLSPVLRDETRNRRSRRRSLPDMVPEKTADD
ncbi:MAG: hypothetical protein H7841_14810 [Magnetospirillum sp. WYHS-4]